MTNQASEDKQLSNTTDREEWRNWLASHGLPHNEVEGELILDFIEALISNREKLARIEELEEIQKLWVEGATWYGINDCITERIGVLESTLRKELDGGQSDE